jgi:hypothetical protein
MEEHRTYEKDRILDEFEATQGQDGAPKDAYLWTYMIRPNKDKTD